MRKKQKRKEGKVTDGRALSIFKLPSFKPNPPKPLSSRHSLHLPPLFFFFFSQILPSRVGAHPPPPPPFSIAAAETTFFFFFFYFFSFSLPRTCYDANAFKIGGLCLAIAVALLDTTHSDLTLAKTMHSMQHFRVISLPFVWPTCSFIHHSEVIHEMMQ